MSHPIGRPDGGNCPATHPVRLPGVFFEVLFDVNNGNVQILIINKMN